VEVAVGLYTLNPADPSLEAPGLVTQPLHLQCDILASTFACKFTQLVPLRRGGGQPTGRGGGGGGGFGGGLRGRAPHVVYSTDPPPPRLIG
jgi:hypothetical protein